MAGYLSLTDADQQAMLAAIGVSSIDELFRDIPAGVRFDRELDLEPALSEPELARWLLPVDWLESALDELSDAQGSVVVLSPQSQQERLRDGARKITKVTEIQGMEGDVITMSDIFEFEQTGVEAGKVIGRVKPTGLRPKFIDKIEAAGIHLPASVFGIGQRY